MELEGVVTNITAFGAFVDVGVHQDGLVHISQLTDRFVKDPHEVVKVGDKIQVRVLEIDLERRRISLTARRGERPPARGTTTQASRPGREQRGPGGPGSKGPKGRPDTGRDGRDAANFRNNPFADFFNKR
jgi:uncharacterized protein